MLEAFEQRFEALHPDVDVQWIDMGSQEVLDRLRSEKANPQADVWWGAPSTMFETAAAEGLLEAYTPSWADALPADAKDAEGYWFGTYVTPEVIAFNSEAVTGTPSPRLGRRPRSALARAGPDPRPLASGRRRLDDHSPLAPGDGSVDAGWTGSAAGRQTRSTC